jgi:hypothetical protein
MKLTCKVQVVLGATVALMLVSMPASAQKNNKNKEQLPAIFLRAQYIYVEAYDGDEYDPRLPQEDRKAIADVAQAVQEWGRYRLTLRRSDADIVILVRKGRLASATGRVEVSVDTVPTSVQFPPDNKTETNTRLGAGAEVGPPDDMLSVHMLTNGQLASPLWRKMQKDGLQAPSLKLFQKFKDEVEAAAAGQAKTKSTAPPANPNGAPPSQKPDPNHPQLELLDSNRVTSGLPTAREKPFPRADSVPQVASDMAASHSALFEVTLVVFFGAVEGSGRGDFRRDGTRELLAGLESQLGRLCGRLLFRRVRENRAAVLFAKIGSLAIYLGRIVHMPERVDQRFIADLVRIECDSNHFGMSSLVRADVLVRGIACVPVAVAYLGLGHAGNHTKFRLDSPEASGGKRCGFSHLSFLPGSV